MIFAELLSIIKHNFRMTDAKDGTSEFFSSMLVLGSLSEQLKLELQRSTLEIYQRERQRERCRSSHPEEFLRKGVLKI